MLMAHKIIDAALGRGRRNRLWVKPGTREVIQRNLIRGIAEAEKFDFGELVLENVENKYRLPDLTNDEKEFWVEGLIPLPHSICWYEYSLGGKRIGLLICEDAEKATADGDPLWIVQRVDQQGDTFVFDGALGGIHRRQQDPHSDRWRIVRGGNKNYEGTIPNEIQMSFMADIMVSIYLTLMINSKTTEVRTERTPEKLNKARQKRGETPLFDHRIVRIVPVRYLRDAECEASGTHASPKLHWRRSHRRTLHRGQPNEFHIAIPRFLVGRAEIGVISHEYKVTISDEGSK